MRKFFIAAAILSATAAPAMADDFGRHQGRAFWLNDQAWPNPQNPPVRRTAPKFTLTYTDAIAERLGVSGGRMDFFEHRLGSGETGPALVGTVDGGHALLALRWHPGE